MSKLLELIKTLRAFTILIIENEFSYVENPKLILGKCIKLTDENFFYLLTDLEEAGFSEISEQLKIFNKKWLEVPNLDMAEFEKIGLDYPDFFLKKIGHQEIINEPLAILTKKIADDNDDCVKSIFLKNGIYIDEAVPKYREILTLFNSIKECRVIIKKERPTVGEWDNFKSQIEGALLHSRSHFCLSIIDKSLGGGGNEGKEFIKELIEAHKNDERFKHICCLYTSTAASVLPENYDDYFIQEISKNSEDSITDIVSALAQSAYAEVFNSLRIKTIASAEHTLKIVLKNQKNIKYIIDKSHEEGIPAYDSIKYWNELSIQNDFDDREVNDFKFIASLTSFFNKDYLVDHPHLSQVSKELKKINTYELFDYNINKKHLPIAPGDIWEANGEYYILVGQLCDLLLRKETNERNARIGELFKIEFGKPQKHKYEIVINNGKKSIFIDNFNDFTDKLKTIRIDISTPNIFFADLKVLDLAMYNEKGACDIDPLLELDETTKQILPANRDIYFHKLKNEYKNLGMVNVRQLLNALDGSDPIDFSRLKFQRTGNVISHGLQRICRLKGRYFDSLYNNYLNNKGRVDLNLIDNASETSDLKIINYQFGNNSQSKKNIELNVYYSKAGIYLLKKELLSKLSSEFHELVNYFDDEVQISDKKYAEIIESEDGSLEIKFRYRIDDKTLVEVSVEEFDFRYLFKNNQNRYKGKEFYISESKDDTRSFSTSKIHINDLLSGIVIPEIKEKVSIMNGLLKIEQIEE
ncbi:hypothetical protein [Pedobacter polysacchareus]|uniref:hypothetical protein n=1 Tax=Pedobacter polysacchareus TaxID=2861973 RepID=UPI001C991382|nr:hypothetical protein [Pedobacter polysacchareus]